MYGTLVPYAKRTKSPIQGLSWKNSKSLGEASLWIASHFPSNTTKRLKDQQAQAQEMLGDSLFFTSGLQKTLNENLFYRAGILAIIFCYYIRIQLPHRREEYLTKLLPFLPAKYGIRSTADIHTIVNAEHNYLLLRMQIPKDIAKNFALRENIYTMFVCMMNRIPLFVVGSPGCSKSLSVQLLLKHLRGRDSPDPYFRVLNELVMVYFQGSSTCTSEGILKVLERAKKLQRSAQVRKYLSVFVFDEIGLAELSPYNPLKVLHSELEIDSDLDFEKKEQVAFIGNSNIRLDSSKMNRALYLARPDPTEKDLIITAEQIYKSVTDSEGNLEMAAELSTAYYRFRDQSKKDKSRMQYYYGLRDFYGMIKQISREINNQAEGKRRNDRLAIVRNSIERNFGFLKPGVGGCDTMLKLYGSLSQKEKELNEIPRGNVLEFIKENLSDNNSRYLMLIGKGDIPSYILDHKLARLNQARRTIVGSTFPNDLLDKEYATKLLHDVITLTAKDLILVFRGMEHIYSSLYDLFNQNFSYIGDSRYCKVAIGAEHNPRCLVNDKLHIIIFLEDSKVDVTEPPFLNRFEKHYLSFDNVMEEEHRLVYDRLKSWVDSILALKDESKGMVQLARYHIFMNYSEDLLKILAMNAVENKLPNMNEAEMADKCKEDLIKLAGLELQILVHTSKLCDYEAEKILKLYNKTHSDSFSDVVRKATSGETQKMVIYTYSPLIDQDIKRIMPEELSRKVMQKIVSAYRYENELKDDINKFYNTKELSLLLLDFDMQTDAEHILFVKATLENLEQDYRYGHIEKTVKNVCFLFHLKRNQRFVDDAPRLVTFEGWNSLMIDDIHLKQFHALNSEFFKKSTNDLIKEGKILDKRTAIIDSLEKCFLYFKYEISGNIDKEDINRKRTLFITKISKNEDLLNALISKVSIDIENQPVDDWKIGMYSNAEVVISSITTMDAIRNYLKKFIEKSLLRVLYTLENQMALLSYFTEEEAQQKLVERIWLNYFEKLKIDPSLEILPLMETSVAKYYFKLQFPFSWNEYQIYKRCFISFMYNQNIQGPFDYILSEFAREHNERTLLGRDELKMIRTNSYLSKLYIHDMVTQLLFGMDIDLKWIPVLETVLQGALSNPLHPKEKLFYLFYCEKPIRTFLMIVSLVEENTNFKELLEFISRVKFNVMDTFISDSMFNQYLADVLLEVCKAFVFSTKYFDPLKSSSFLEKLHMFLKEFSELTGAQLPLLNSINFLRNYVKLLKLKKKDSLDTEILENFQKTEKPDTALTDYTFFNYVRGAVKSAFSQTTNKNDKDMLRKFLSNYYIEIMQKESKAIGNYLADFNELHMWKFSADFFAEIEDDLYQLFINFMKGEFDYIDAVKNQEVLNIIEYYLKEKDIEADTFAIATSDSIARLCNIYTPSETHKTGCGCLECCKGCVAENWDTFLLACDVLENNPTKPYPKLYKLIALVAFRQYLDAFSAVIGKVESGAVIIEISQKLSENTKIAATGTLYCCKKLFIECGSSYYNLYLFLKDKVKEFKWMERFLVNEVPEKSPLDGKLPVFALYKDEVKQFSTELYLAIQNKFANSEEFLKRMKAYLKEGKSIVVFLSFLSVVYSSSHHNPELAKEVSVWLKNCPLSDVSEIHAKFLQSLTNNFEDIELLALPKEDSDNFKSILIVTLVAISVFIQENPISSCFFKDGRLADFTTTFSKFQVPSAPDDEYLHALRTKYMERASAGFTLYQCSEACEYIYYVEESGKVLESEKCELCGKSIGGINYNQPSARAEHIKKSYDAEDSTDFTLKNQERNIEVIKEAIKIVESKAHKGIDLAALNSKEKSKTTRDLDPVTYRLLNLIIVANAYYVSEVYQLSPEIVKQTFNVEGGKELSQTIKDLLHTIYEILDDPNMETIIWSMVTKLPEVMKEYLYKPETVDLRDKFEAAINNKVVKQTLANVTQAKSEYHASKAEAESKENTMKSISTLTDLLLERTLDCSAFPFSCLLRLVKNPDVESFKKYYAQSYAKEECRLVDYYLNNNEGLEELKVLHPLIDFTNGVMNQCLYRYRRSEAESIEVKDFLKDVPELAPKYERLIDAWKRYIEGKVLAVNHKKKIVKVPQLSQCKFLSGFLLDSREDTSGFGLYATMYQLGNYQNKVLIDVYSKKNDARGLEKLIKNKIPLQKLSHDSIINLNMDIKEMINGAANPKYGMGTKIFYDFEGLESKIHSQFIGAKVANIENIRTVIYREELFSEQSSLIADFSTNIPQREMTLDSRETLDQHLNLLEGANPGAFSDYLRILYSSLYVVFLYAKNEKFPPEGLLIDFCHKYIANRGWLSKDLYERTPVSNTRMANLVELFEMVENRYFPYFKQSVASNYKNDKRADEVQRMITEFYLAEAQLKNYPSVEELLKFTQRLIMRKFTVHNPADCPIAKYFHIREYWPKGTNKDKCDSMYKDFPKEITVGETLTLYSCLETMVAKRQEERAREAALSGSTASRVYATVSRTQLLKSLGTKKLPAKTTLRKPKQI
eukprot:TRINITY_DN2598_c0_g3_i2.p2 TRINITY_DN2598_c0_g3~~TRINITY_DN2598_c0_g3_i2.p2  ORF type:complete len:2504 (-),score=308.31 TRINITY_DN2598_c0_g3_i2:80-7591(-)